MTNERMARRYIEQAKAFLGEAEGHFQTSLWHLCVRRSQEAIEIAAKAALRIVGVEPPKLHDVGAALLQQRDRFPTWFGQAIDQVASASAEWSEHRGPSYYGDEEHGIPPDELYDQTKATEAIEASRRIYRLCSKLIEEIAPAS